MQDFDDGGGCSYEGPGGISEIFVPSVQFCCEPKNSLKDKVKKTFNKFKNRKQIYVLRS